MTVNVRGEVADETIAAFGRRFDGEIIRPSDPEYEGARLVWNAMVDKRPALIARPLGTADVVEAIRLARAEGLEVAVRGGGHNAVGHSMSDGGLTLDLSRMRGVRIDPDGRRAWVQGGALLGDLDREASPFGLATPAGVVSHTGVGGLTLGGGYGYLARLHGLACDNVEAYEVVTASGEVLRATENAHPDLFWALRGGGGNFGVVTGFEFRLHPIPPSILSFDLGYALDDAIAALRAFAALSAEAPDAMQTSAAIVTAPDAEFIPPEHRGRPMAWVSYTYAGDLDEGRRYADALRTGAQPIVTFDEAIAYRDLQRSGDESQRHGRRRYVKSHFVPALSDAFLETFLTRGGRDGRLVGGSLGQLGGAIARVGADASPFSGRDAAFDFVTTASWDDPAEDEARLAAARGYATAIAPFSTGRAYVNALDDAFANETANAYGTATHSRLAAVKSRYDPDNLFRLNQNVAPTSPSGTP